MFDARMNIVTNALNRLQAKQARSARNPETMIRPDRSDSSGFPEPNVLTPQHPSQTLRTILRLPLIILGVGGIGIGAYLWDLPLKPDVATVMPKPETNLGLAIPVNLMESVVAQVVEGIPEQRPEEESLATATTNEFDSTRHSDPIKSSAELARQTKASEISKLSPDRAPSRNLRAQAMKQPAMPPVQQTLHPQANVRPQKSSGVPSEPRLSQRLSSRESQPRAFSVASPKRSDPLAPSISRNAMLREATLVQAKGLIHTQRYRQAVTILQPLFIEPPDTWGPWFWLGTAKLGLGQWKEAAVLFVEGLARDAKVPHLWVQHALVSQQQGKWREAIEALRHAEFIAPELPEVQLNLAYSFELQGDMKNAVAHYHTFLAMTEGKTPYHGVRKKVLERVIHLRAT